MKNLLFIGMIIILGSCSMQQSYFSKRVPANYEVNELSIHKDTEKPIVPTVHLSPIVEEEVSFEFVSNEIIPAESFEVLDSTKTIKSKPMFEKSDSASSQCKCFGKSLIMSGSVLSLMGIATFFAWTTLGIGALVIGLLMLTVGIIIVRKK